MDGRSRRMSDVEQSAIESLLSCSEKSKEEAIDRVVVTSNWTEVARGWRNAKPNACYVSSPEKRKKSKDKFQTSPAFSDPESQLEKVKKLAGMIANSNIILKEENSATKLKTARNVGLAKYQNCGVLSYDVPCWRFIMDPKRYRYVERLGFFDIRALNDTKRSSISRTLLLDNGGMITYQEVNGRIALFDPALTFDRHLLETYELREEYKLRSCHRTNGSFDYSTDFSQIRTEDNKIKVVQTIISPRLSAAGPCSSCEMCRHRTQELGLNPPKIPSPRNKGHELKPLQKITPSQKRAAEDNRAVSKVLVPHGRTKEVTLKSVKEGKDSKKVKEGKLYHSRHTVRLDWLPITRNTIAYPYMQGASGSDSGTSSSGSSTIPDQPSSSVVKTYALPRHHTKARKLTLSEAASLVPKSSRFGNTFDKLTKDLENKHDKPISLSEPLLPSVSGTKLEVSLSGINL